jgi:hypothetical protein
MPLLSEEWLYFNVDHYGSIYYFSVEQDLIQIFMSNNPNYAQLNILI